MFEEAYNSIISAGSVAVILTAGIILIYRHMSAEKKELQAQLAAKDLVIAAKDTVIEKKDTELKEILKENIKVQIRILDILKIQNNES